MTLTKDEVERLAQKINVRSGGTKKQTEDAIRDYINGPAPEDYKVSTILKNNGRVILQELGAPRLATKLFGGQDD